MSTHVFLERTFDTPVSISDMEEGGRKSAWCLELHKVDWQQTFLAGDGRRAVCWFVAPDAESARLALRESGVDIRRLWSGTVHSGSEPEPVAPNVLVERSFAEPVTFERIQAIEHAGASCLQTHRVDFVRTFFSFDRKRMLCLYAAPDAESVRLAQREAAMPVDAIWTFVRLAPGAS